MVNQYEEQTAEGHREKEAGADQVRVPDTPLRHESMNRTVASRVMSGSRRFDLVASKGALEIPERQGSDQSEHRKGRPQGNHLAGE
jgi:hypothetical protein